LLPTLSVLQQRKLSSEVIWLFPFPARDIGAGSV
jgi:hypothetical protein